MDLRAVGDLLRDCREGTALRRGKLSQGALSARTATPDLPPIDVNTISSLERGDSPQTRLDTVLRLLAALDVRASVFFRHLEGGPETPVDLRQPVSGSEVVAREPQGAPVSPTYEELATENRDLRRTIRVVTRAAEAYSGELESDDRHDSSARRDPAEHRPTARTHRQRTVPRAKKKRRPRKRG